MIIKVNSKEELITLNEVIDDASYPRYFNEITKEEYEEYLIKQINKTKKQLKTFKKLLREEKELL